MLLPDSLRTHPGRQLSTLAPDTTKEHVLTRREQLRRLFRLPSSTRPDAGAIARRIRYERLAEAQADLYRLLDHLIQFKSPQIPRATLDRIATLGRLDVDALDPAGEADLLELRGSLAQAVRPATPSGIRLLELLEGARRGLRSEPDAARTYRSWLGARLLTVLILLVLVHVYVSVLGKVCDSTARHLAEFDGARFALEQLVSQASTRGTPTAGRGKEPTRTVPGAAGKARSAPGSLTPSAPAAPSPPGATPSLARLDSDAERLNVMLARDHEELEGILNPIALLRSSRSPAVAAATADLGSVDEKFRVVSKQLVWPTSDLVFRGEVLRSQLEQLILPTLYGLIGALLFALREMSMRTEDAAVQALTRYRYRIRLVIGGIFGLIAAGPFLGVAATMQSFGLTAALAALLAGYATEVVFSFLDQILSRVRTALRIEPTTTANGDSRPDADAQPLHR